MRTGLILQSLEERCERLEVVQSTVLSPLFVQSSNSMDTTPKLHVVLFPWLAIGHLIPFFHLSKSLAQKGLQISFISTPRNIQRLPKIPPNLSHLINLITFPLPPIQNLPPNAEASTDLPIKKSQYLKKAFDGLQSPLTTFLQSSNPDWIIFDYASHWVPGIGAQLGIPCIYFCVFTAATQAFAGPPWALLSKDDKRVNPEDFTVVPEWIPFPSNIVFRYHELLHYFEGAEEIVSGFSDIERFGYSIRDCDFVALRSCVEFESDWLSLLSELYQKPVIPIGVLPPGEEEVGDEIDEKWVGIKEWLDKQREGSVVYVALGTEAVLSQEQLNELALGLEQSKLPFFWVLRKPPLDSVIPQLPDGFEDRIGGRGLVYMSWAPQVKILSHPSVGGFLTHCGYNSIIEGLGLGRVLILLPILNDQGLNARLLEEKQLGLEIPRNEQDGSFSSESVAKSVRVVMVEKEGEELRNKAKEMKAVFGDKGKNDCYIDGFVKYLNEYQTPASRV